jgi:hypothetical protein
MWNVNNLFIECSFLFFKKGDDRTIFASQKKSHGL